MDQQEPLFNADLYKQTTIQQWNASAEAWHRWSPLINRWLGPATETMLDMCDIKQGSKVLDIAAGAGEQTITVARRIGHNGEVLATDISPDILHFAAETAHLQGLDNVQTRVIDGENIAELEQNDFDAVISRVGLIYFPDQHKALCGMKKLLRQGGKSAAMVYSSAESNAFFSIPVSIIRRRANLPVPQPGQPGPFSLGDISTFADTFKRAGFRDVEIETVKAPLRVKSVAECLQFEQESFAALHQMLSGLSDMEKDDTWCEIEDALQQFEIDGQFSGPCELLIAVGSK